MGTRTYSLLLCFSALTAIALGAPLLGFEDEDLDDTATVESTVREVRAIKPSDLEVAPAHYSKTYGDGDNDEIGYSRKKADKGKTGYQKFDSFHKKGGDSYGYEKHDSFGAEEKGESGSHSDYKKKDGKKKDDGASAKYVDGSDYSGEEGDDGYYEESSGESEGDSGGDYEGDYSEGGGDYDY